MTMSLATQLHARERDALSPVRTLANQAFSRAAGAPLVGGNSVRLLKDARENYPAWLEAIGAAKRHIHLESYIIHEDNTGREFADALIAKAREGVRVRLIYDWMGGFGKTSRAFWNRLRAGGVEVRCYNLRWSRFDGHQCGLENKRHDHEKEIFQFISPAGQDDPTQI
jgi:cardiolipin synthase